MTIKKIITLHNLLISLCVIVILLIGYKGYQYHQKVTWITEADRLFAENKLVEAEVLYSRAQSNKYLDYHEDKISSRLKELAPITKINNELIAIGSSAKSAASKRDFDSLMNVYYKLQKVRSTYMEPEGKYSPYYRQISENLEISSHFTNYFNEFKKQFLAQGDNNLKKSEFADESFKWNLLRIPSAFFGGPEAYTAQLISSFTSYDEAKMEKMASSGKYDKLYADVLQTLKKYKENEITAHWVTTQIEKIVLNLLSKDVENSSYGVFATNAKQYEAFANQAGLPPSEVNSYITKVISNLMKEAKQLATKHEFLQAIELYGQLSNYKDTAEEVKAVKLAWVKAEPIRLLPEPKSSYEYVSGGTDRFGSKIYVAAIANETNQILFGRMNTTDSSQVLTYSNLPKTEHINSMIVDKNLSLSSYPILLIQSASENRNAIYTALEVQNDQIVQLYRIEADDITVNVDGTLTVTNPTGEGAGQTAIFDSQGDNYLFLRVLVSTTDIAENRLAEYRGVKVRFTTTVTGPGYGEVLAFTGDSYIMLRGDFNFNEGSYTVTGVYSYSTDTEVNDEPMTIPVFEVESIQ